MLYSMYSRHKKNLAARFAPHKQKRQVGDAYISDLSFPSKLREAFPHLLVIELALLRLLQHIHRFRDGGVPLIPTNLLPVLPLLQPVIGAVILHLGRGAVGFALGLLAVSAHLPAGALCLTGSNVAAVAGVISCRQQKIPPAVMAAARRVARSQSPVEFRSQEVRQTVEGSLLRYEDAGLGHIRFHDLRHTFATLALQNGVDIKTVSSMLGHYDAGFTLRTYTHATRQKQDEAAETMGNFMEQVM